MLYTFKSKFTLLTLLCCFHSSFSQKISFEKSFGGKHSELLFDALPTPDYGFILAGSSISNKNGNKADNNKGDLDYWIWKMDEKGELIFQKSFGGSGVDLLQSIQLTKDGGYLLAGTSTGEKSRDKGSNIGGSDFWVVKLKDESKPDNVKVILEALPNPATTFTNVIVNYEYTEGTATVYDLAGRQLSQTKITGEHTIPVDLSKLPQGIYIVDVRTNNGQDGVKVIKN